MSSEEYENVEEIDPEKEPEYIGAHSALKSSECRNWKEPHADGKCGEPATHTVVEFYRDELMQISMCDECGEPEDVTDFDREWTGEVISG